jgi:hypothetical protein
MATLQDISTIAFIGIGATATMDAWLSIQKRMGARALDFALIGRWAGHLLRGKFAHASIARAPPVWGERAWGWLMHYAVGIAFAGVLVGLRGHEWAHSPSLLPAVALGVATVVLPLFVMQPAMGAGFASAKTATPFKNSLRSLANHTVFGLGLYLSAVVLALISK